MNKYLIFRTDRIGDFLVTAILIKCIKDNDVNAHITIVASSKNYDYIKSFKSVDEVILLKTNLINKILLVIKLFKERFKYIILHDDKKRSHLIAFFLKKELKISLNYEKTKTHLEILEIISKLLNFKLEENHFNILQDREINDLSFSNFVQLHFDEKWIHNNYIEKFVNIEPNPRELASFINSIGIKTNKKVLLTTGKTPPSVLLEALNMCKNKNILFLKNLSFIELENIILKSDLLISCHGSVSHVASAKRIKQIDIIDTSYPYNIWTHHFRNYNSVNRDKFAILAKKILEKI